jgi:hypothetical protein
LRHRLLAGADDRQLGRRLLRQPSRRHARHRAGAQLAEREGLDHRAQCAGRGVEQDQQRRGTGAGVRPGLGAGDARADIGGAERVQRIAAAPFHMRLQHALGRAGRFRGEAAFDRRDRGAQVEQRRDVSLADPQRVHHEAPSKIDGTGGARPSALTIRLCVT